MNKAEAKITMVNSVVVVFTENLFNSN